MDVDLPEDDEIQIVAVGMVLGQGQPPYINVSNGQLNKPQDTTSDTKNNKQGKCFNVLFSSIQF